MKLSNLLPGKEPISTSSTEAPNNSEGFDALEKDVALALVGEHSQAIDPVVEARVVRKIDRFLILAMIIGMLLIFINRGHGWTTLASARNEVLGGSNTYNSLHTGYMNSNFLHSSNLERRSTGTSHKPCT